MYCYQNPYFYSYPGQFYILPPVVQPQFVQICTFDVKQTASQEEKKQSNLNHEAINFQKSEPLQLQKPCDSKQRKIQIDSDYEPQNNEAMIFYKKKNTESNLSNQIYSFISSYRSNYILLKIFDQNQHKVKEFYKLVKKIKKSNKKYMNRNYIAELVQLKEENTNYKIYKRLKSQLHAEEIRKAMRISLKYFIQNVCDVGLLTSKKMNKTTLIEHFTRKREIKQFLFQSLVLDENN